MTEIGKLISRARSKNAGPFMTTFDLMFKEKKNYERVKRSGLLTRERIASLYHLKPEEVRGVFFLDAFGAIKITILKPLGLASGDIGCSDTYGSDQAAPILSMNIP